MSRMSSFQVDRCFESRKMFTNMPGLCLRRMTVGQGGGSGVEGPSKPDRKPEGGEDGESADQASEETSTKRVGEETLNPSSAASPGLAPTLSTQTSSPPGVQLNPTALSPVLAAPNNQDQHHFLRSSVRPPSKRIRKDAASPALNGHGGAKAKGEWPSLEVCVRCSPVSASVLCTFMSLLIVFQGICTVICEFVCCF